MASTGARDKANAPQAPPFKFLQYFRPYKWLLSSFDACLANLIDVDLPHHVTDSACHVQLPVRILDEGALREARDIRAPFQAIEARTPSARCIGSGFLGIFRI